MNDKTKAILEITAPNGQEFVDKGAIVNQSNALNGVCIELYIPTKAIQTPVDTDSLQGLIAQAEADKKAYPLAWWTGYEYHSKPEGWNIFKKEPSHDIKFFNFRRLKNADLIMQCAQDKIDYPDFWHELTQWKSKDESSWASINSHQFSFNYAEAEYRQHPHRENIIAYHACSEADKKRWQFRRIGTKKWSEWSVVKPEWREDSEYRLRPRACYITLQDGTKMEFPEPARSVKNGEKAYYINSSPDGYSFVFWCHDASNMRKLNRGEVHLSEESIKQHLAVIQAMNTQVAI